MEKATIFCIFLLKFVGWQKKTKKSLVCYFFVLPLWRF